MCFFSYLIFVKKQVNIQFRIESFSLNQNKQYQPRLLCFLSKFKGQGLEIYFSETKNLTLRSNVKNIDFDYPFTENKWYFISIVHKKLLFGDEAILYVNGSEVSKKKITYPTINHDDFGFYIGTNFLIDTSFCKITNKYPFYGQIGLFLFFFFLFIF